VLYQDPVFCLYLLRNPELATKQEWPTDFIAYLHACKLCGDLAAGHKVRAGVCCAVPSWRCTRAWYGCARCASV
jgi:hypothetical protein